MSQFLVRFSILITADDEALAAAEVHEALRTGRMPKVTWLVNSYSEEYGQHPLTTEITTESPRVH